LEIEQAHGDIGGAMRPVYVVAVKANKSAKSTFFS
jgi:hypothetical protein